jgi:SAM-dependent methyltransferase
MLECLDSFSVRDVCAEYRRQLGVDVSGEFASDVRRLDLCLCTTCGIQYVSPIVSGSPAFYAALGAQAAYYARARWEFGRALELIQPEEQVLDVGCGDGRFLSSLPQGSAFGIEWNPAAVKEALGKGLDVRHCGLDEIDSSCVDVVTMFQVLEHVTDPVRLLTHAARVLRPGGKLLVAVPNNESFLGEGLHEPLNLPPHHPLRWTVPALEAVVRLLPFALKGVEVEPLAREHLFHYRKWRMIRRFRRLTGWKLRRLSLDPLSVILRKCVHAWVLFSPQWTPRPSVKQTPGHSILAIYRRI